MGIYCYLFSSFKFEVSQVPNGQKQALVNAIKYVCLPTSRHLCRHPSVSLQVQNYYKILRYANFKATIVRESDFWNGNEEKRQITFGRMGKIVRFCVRGTFPRKRFCGQGTFWRNKFCGQGTFFSKIICISRKKAVPLQQILKRAIWKR